MRLRRSLLSLVTLGVLLISTEDGSILNPAAAAAAAKPRTAGIIKGPVMRLAGTHTFTLTPGTRGKQIVWTVNREETDDGGGAPTLTKNVLSATGHSASFKLPKTSGKETIYYIHAKGDGFSDTQKVQVFSANERSSFTYKSAGNPDVRTYIVVPANLNSSTRIVVVMHGRGRNADGYIDSWVEWAARHNRIALAPQFDANNWLGLAKYNYGNVFTGDNGAGTKNPEAQWAFTIVEGIHQKVRSEFDISDRLFDIWGHSAGGQFVHRFMLFKPKANVRYALAANSGTYTTPDPNLNFPFGVKHPLLSFTDGDIIKWTNKPLVIFRGTADTLRTENLMTTPEADAQGPNRYERAAFMYRKVLNVNPSAKWQMIDVPGSGHDQRKMAPAAQEFLLRSRPDLSRS